MCFAMNRTGKNGSDSSKQEFAGFRDSERLFAIMVTMRKTDSSRARHARAVSDKEHMNAYAARKAKGQNGKAPAGKKTEKFGWPLTLGLFALLGLIIVCLWALFISGPARIHDRQKAEVIATMEEIVPGVEGLSENKFDYVTWQGYTSDTLYWFDMTGQIITSRPMTTLDYDKAEEKARTKYDLEAETVTLAYGYSGPVYQLESDERILMLDYDTLDWVYERNLNHAQSN